MQELLKAIDWSEGFYKGAFLLVLAILCFSLFHGIKFFGKRFISIFESMQLSIKELTHLSDKQDTQIQLMKREQKIMQEEHEFTKERVGKHDEHIDFMMKHLLQATKK